MKQRTEHLHVRVAPEVRQGIEAAATAARRSASNMVEVVLADWLAQQRSDQQQQSEAHADVAA